jgi:glycosyltransferase involved in cell wall biosynthesis
MSKRGQTVTRRADQILAGFAEDDAISQDALLLQGIFRGLGWDSDLFVPRAHTDPAAAARVRPLEAYAGAPGDVAVLHDVLDPAAAAAFRATPARRVLRYHNITPGACFAPFDGALAERLDRARAELGGIAALAESVWPVSAFNAAELPAGVAARCRVLPLLFEEARFRLAPDPAVAARYAGPLANILFVGRLVPNKCVEELIFAFHRYHRAINPASRLIIAGSERSCPRYAALLRLLAKALDLPNVCFEGFVSPAGLAALYGKASLFATLSRHEGYCLPLVEAMANGVPVLARRAGGMPEALGEAGLQVEELPPAVVAELFADVLHRPAVRREVLDSQARRMEAVRARRPADEVAALLAE